MRRSIERSPSSGRGAGGIRAEDADIEGASIDREKYHYVAEELYNRFDLKIAAITLRESVSASDNNWSGLLFDGREHFLSRRYPIHVVDRVGAGDAFAGALICAFLDGREPRDIIEFAAAASCLKHSVPGDFNLVSRDEVEVLMKGDASGRIQR